MIYDGIVIGGGPAGMLASIVAAQQGAKVLLLERNDRLGKKLLITGKGRCNVTNSCTAQEVLLNIPRNGRFLYSAMESFPPASIMEFLENSGCKLKVERGNRVFPVTDKSSSVLEALRNQMHRSGVQVRTARVQEILTDENGVAGVKTAGESLSARWVILATGGMSYPTTGSTGDGYEMARKLGHDVTGLVPALTAVEVSEDITALKGARVKAEACLYRNGEMIFSERGEVQFREDSLSGICVMNMSRYIKRDGEYKIRLNITPDFSRRELKTMLRNKMSLTGLTAAEALKTLVKGQLILLVLKEACISPDEEGVSILADTGKYEKLADALECLEFAVKGLKGWNEAQVTAGGVVLSQVDSITMESKVVPGLFFSGEVLDYDGPCGGYNLHHAWLTGIRAGRGMALKCTESIR